MKKFLAIILTLAMTLSLVACGGGKTEEPAKTDEPKTEEPAKTEDSSADVYKIGVVLPMTGGSARMGELQYEGIKLFAEHYNEKLGGIQSLGGAKIELILADSTGDPSTGGSEAERLINNEKVDALIGPYNSSVGAVIQPIAEKYGVPFAVTNCTADTVMMTEGELKYTFRPNHSNSTGVETINKAIEYLAAQDANVPLNSFAIIYENTDWGNSCVDTYAAGMVAAGMEMKICESFESGSADFSTIVNKVKAAGVDFIVPCMYTSDSVLFMSQYTEYGLTTPLIWVGGGILTDEFITSLGDLAENQISMCSWTYDSMADSNDPELCQWVHERCMEDTGSQINENITNGWIGMGVLIDAVERAATKDKDAVAKAARETKLGRDSLAMVLSAYPGIEMGDTPTWDGTAIMQNQNKTTNGIFIQIVDGEYRQIWPDWSGNPLVWPIP